MVGKGIKDSWEELWHRLDADARAAKASQRALIELSDQYRTLSPTDRQAVDQILAEWALSDDEGKRFDAIALISEHGIVTALASLRILAERLKRSGTPSAPFDLAKVNRAISRLAGEVNPH